MKGIEPGDEEPTNPHLQRVLNHTEREHVRQENAILTMNYLSSHWRIQRVRIKRIGHGIVHKNHQRTPGLELFDLIIRKHHQNRTSKRHDNTRIWEGLSMNQIKWLRPHIFPAIPGGSNVVHKSSGRGSGSNESIPIVHTQVGSMAIPLGCSVEELSRF